MGCAMCSKRPQTPLLVYLKQGGFLAWAWVLDILLGNLVYFVFSPLPEWGCYPLMFMQALFFGVSVFLFLVSPSAVPDFFPFPAKEHPENRYFVNWMIYCAGIFLVMTLICFSVPPFAGHG